MTDTLPQRIEVAEGARYINVNCLRGPLTCRCDYHKGYVAEPPTFLRAKDHPND